MVLGERGGYICLAPLYVTKSLKGNLVEGNGEVPPADPENRRRRGGLSWGRIIAALLGRLLPALLIPLACGALRGGSSDPRGVGDTRGEQQSATEETARNQAQSAGESTAASVEAPSLTTGVVLFGQRLNGRKA